MNITFIAPKTGPKNLWNVRCELFFFRNPIADSLFNKTFHHRKYHSKFTYWDRGELILFRLAATQS